MESVQVDEIQEIIRKEKEEAERGFEGARFDARLFERIRKAREPRPTAWPIFLIRPGPVVAFSVLVLAFAGFLLFRTFSPSPLQPTIRAMGAVLEKSGAGRGTSGQDRTAQRIATAEYTEFGWAIKGVLYACKRQALGDVSLTDALSRVLAKGTSQAASGREKGEAAAPGEESFKLQTAEDFRMFFAGFLQKLKEV